MIGSIGKKQTGSGDPADVLLAFVQSWNMHGRDETSICSRAVDVLRAYLGDRPCCVWRNVKSGVTKICERGMIDLFFKQESENHQNALTRVLVSGTSEFDAGEMGLLAPELKSKVHGFLNIPIKIQEDVLGILSLAVHKKEARNSQFVQVMECLGRLIAIAIQHGHDSEANISREQRLRTELEATTRELAHTNKRLIERVRELKTVSKELEKRVEELTHASRAKDEFLSVVSHELRTPLTSLTGFLCVLLDQEAGPITTSQERFLTIAKQSAERLNVLISDLLDISRIESGRLNLDMNVCSLFDILKTSVQGLKNMAESKKIHIKFDASANQPNVWGDSSRLQQVVDNILSNAIKFTPHEGKITVVSIDKGDAIQVSIKDSGPGIDSEEAKRIFDMFYQVDASSRRSKGGAGLGLAIAHGIVGMHGGKLWMNSEKDKGTEFVFVIPRHKSQKAA